MIIGIGIDSIEIKRFELWKNYPKNKLLKIFSDQEINYCLENPIKSAERLAARFAAREAFYKALCQITTKKTPFLTVCKHVQIRKNQNNAPVLHIDWKYLGHSNINSFISITHTKTTATAFVVLESFLDNAPKKPIL